MKILPVSMATAKEQYSSFFIEIYIIRLLTGVIRLCNCDEEIVFDGEIYSPVPIQRGTIKSTVDAKIDNVELKIADADKSKVAALLSGFDFRGKMVDIYKILYPDSLSDSNIVFHRFTGKLDTPTYSNGEFTCIVKSAFPKIETPTRKTQYCCQNDFGDSTCGLSKSILGVTIDVANSTPTRLKLANPSVTTTNYYKNGLVTMGYETKLIKENTADGYIVSYYPFLSDISTQATLRRNCNKTPEMCLGYNNRHKYTGFLSVPKEYRLS